ncbi:hypothetical protein SAMN05216548_13110 [Faunimonas pinastri]|uniref:Uncharacterized protein n=1 Tax=Faunimonas pinastri TaxID=1855383 RepID=A0A1H9QN38_9HYPH|nr:hypothetical protein [Faunimonas pinastri]SER62001.1 hypothetical protein SAMN05216548_13110 [Faunimonas pinastri]
MMLTLVRGITSHFRARVTEWALAGALFGWGYILKLPSPTFDQPSYGEMARFASEDTWGQVCFWVGLVRIVALIVNGSIRPSYHLRAVLAFFSCFIWFQILIGLIKVGTVSTGIAMYAVVFALEVYNVICAFGDAGKSDRQAAERGAAKNGRE